MVVGVGIILVVVVVVIIVVVVVLIVLVVVVGGISVGVTPTAFFLGSVVAENRQIGDVFACFCYSRGKKHRKYQCFWRIGSPTLKAKSTILQCFLANI